MTQYRIKLLAVPGRNGCEDLPEAYYGDVDFPVSMNFAIYCRTDLARARTFTRDQALYALRTDLRGWPARCEPPITVTY